jgi:hypothetical protein
MGDRVVFAPIDLWVRAYTAGLPDPVRERRRLEIESDVWEEVEAFADRGSSRAAIRAAVWLRWLAGVPDDVLWRVEQPRNRRNRPNAAERSASAMHATTDRSVVVPGAIVALAIVAALVLVTVDNIQYLEQSQRFVSTSTLMTLSLALFAAGLAGLVAGFVVMRSRPMTGAILASGGSIVAAVMTFWLIVPLVVALVISAVAIRRARRLARLGA